MKRNYECMLILAADKPEDKRAELITQFSKMASASTRVEKMGMRKFSVPINYKAEGFYVLLHFEAGAEKIAEMTKVMNITDGVVRFMFVQKTDKQIEADKMRKAQRDKAREQRTEEQPESKKPLKEAKEVEVEPAEVHEGE